MEGAKMIALLILFGVVLFVTLSIAIFTVHSSNRMIGSAVPNLIALQQ